MKTPDFYNRVPTITLFDPLSDFLGSFEKGEITYGYHDAVKLAGHSCPTVAGAYLMTLRALEALYGDQMPRRGDIRIEMLGRQDEGATGVIAQVMTLITGAAGEGGFKGIARLFERRGLLEFGKSVGAEARFTRQDTQKSVGVSYDPGFVPASPEQSVLMRRILSGNAGEEEKRNFGTLWQSRVKAILCDYIDDERLIKIQHL